MDEQGSIWGGGGSLFFKSCAMAATFLVMADILNGQEHVKVEG